MTDQIKTKLVELNLRSSKLWESQTHELDHPHATKIKTKARIYTQCFKLPKAFRTLSTIVCNNIVVYDCGIRPRITSVIGGGGRFEVRRRYYDGEVVNCELMLKDVCYYTKKKPVFKIFVEVEA